MNRQPGDEGAKLRGGKQIHLEHGDGVRPHGLVPEGVDAQLGELAADSLPELPRVGRLVGVGLVVVDVDVAGGM